MSSLFPRNHVASDAKAKKPKKDTAKIESVAQDGLFGVAVKKKRTEGKNDNNKRPRSASADLEKDEDIDSVGDLVRMVKSPSGKGRVPRIIPPTFQGLAKGTLLYGIVKIVTKRQIFVALPFGLNGLVSSNEVSDFPLFKDSGSAAELLDSDEDDVEEEKVGEKKGSKEGKGGATLESLFTVGQTVKGVVMSTSETKSGRRSVQLSLKPSIVNRGLFLEHLGAGSGIYGAVASVEDRGYVVHFGVDGFNGFLKAKDCEVKYRVGQPLDLAVLDVNAASKSISVSAIPTRVLTATAVTQTNILPLRALKPGALVSLTVTRVVDNGLIVNLTMSGKPSKIFGVIDHNHLASPVQKDHWQAMFSKGSTIASARILSLDYAARELTFTLRPHLLAMRPPTGLSEIGHIYEEAPILRVDPKEGLLLGVPASFSGSAEKKAKKASGGLELTVGIYVPLSRVATPEERGIVAGDKSSGKSWRIEKNFNVGESVRVRVLAHNIVEGTGVGTVIESEVDAAVLSASAVEVGQVLKAPIIAVEEWGVLVDLGGGADNNPNSVKALVTSMHLADAAVTDPKKRFRVGAKVNCRILNIEKGGKKVMATMKKALVTDETTILSCYDDCVKLKHLCFQGYVTKIANSGITVTFYNNVHGVIDSKTLIQQGVDDIEEAYVLGQVVKCRVQKLNKPAKGNPKLKLCLDIPGSLDMNGEGEDTKGEVPTPCSMVSGTIVARDKKSKSSKNPSVHVALDAPFNGCTALLPLNHLSDFESLCTTLYKSDDFAPSKKLSNMMVLNVKGSTVQVTLKPTLVIAASTTTKLVLPKSFEEVSQLLGKKKSVDRLVAGVVKGMESYGAFIECAAGFSALIPRAQMPYRLLSKDSESLPCFKVGDTVISSIHSLDAEKKRLVLSCSSHSVTCGRSALALSGSSELGFLPRLLQDRYRAARAEYERQSAGGAASVKPLPDIQKYPLGTTTDAKVLELLTDGSLKLSGDANTVMIAPASAGGCSLSSSIGCHAEGASSLSIGDVVKVRILDVNYKDNVLAPCSHVVNKIGTHQPPSFESHLVVSCSSSLVKAGRSKRRKAAARLLEEPEDGPVTSKKPKKKAASSSTVSTNNSNNLISIDTKVNGTVLLVNAEWGYAVVSISLLNVLEEDENNGCVLGYLMLSDYSCPLLGFSDLVDANKCATVDEVACEGLVVGEVVECTVVSKPLSTHWLQGFDKSTKEACQFPQKENVFLVRAADHEKAIAQASGSSATEKKVQSVKESKVSNKTSIEEDATWSDLVVGCRYRATCKRVREDGCSVTLNSSVPGTNQEVSGFLSVLELAANSKEAQGWANFKSKSYGRKISEGSELVVELVSISREEKSVHLTAHVGQSPRFGQVNSIMVGQVLEADVPVSGQPAVMLALGGNKKARVCITEVCDPESWCSMEVNENGFVVGSSVAEDEDEADRKLHFQHGDFYDVVLLSPLAKGVKGKKGFGRNIVDCSMRASRIKEVKAIPENVKSVPLKQPSMPPTGAVVSGFVSSTSSSGCFVRLQHDLNARVLIKDLADSFVQSPDKDFPPGKLVAGCVLADVEGNHVSLSLRPSKVLGDQRKQMVAAVEVGDICKGEITRVESFGVFVKLTNGIVGLCHVTEAADRFIKDLTKVYSPGDLVKAKVLRVNQSKGQLSIGLKASYFEGLTDSDESESEDMVDDDDEEEEASSEEEDSDNDEGDDDDEEEEDEEEEEGLAPVSEDDESDDENFATKLKQKMEEGDGDDDDDDDDDNAEEEEEEEEDDDDDDENKMSDDSEDETKPKQPSLFAWDDFELSSSKKADAEGESSESEDEDKRKKNTNSKKRAREAEEKVVRQKELDLLQKQESIANDDWDEDDFERALLATPNDSTLWIRYMASKVRTLDIPASRAIAKRALKTILFREEDEKLNVWVAYINLEFKYGTKQALTEVINLACSSSHPKRIRLRVAAMLEEAHLDGNEGLDEEIAREAEAAYAVAAKKHKTSKQVWSAYIRYKLRAGDDIEASKLLQRAIQCLSKHKHVYVISKFAQDEFAFGSIERGRTVFEELLSVHGLKRLDLWNVYIDKEIKMEQYEAARALFSRLVTLKLGNKPIKAAFKKWLAFEKEHGTTKTQNEVKAAARDYVQRAIEQSK